MASSRDRRTHSRFAFKVPAHISFADGERIHRGFVLNLSQSGVFVMLDDSVPQHALIRLHFHIRPTTDCEATGYPARILALGHGHAVGVELTKRNAGYKHFIRNLAYASEPELLAFMRDVGRVNISVAR